VVGRSCSSCCAAGLLLIKIQIVCWGCWSWPVAVWKANGWCGRALVDAMGYWYPPASGSWCSGSQWPGCPCHGGWPACSIPLHGFSMLGKCWGKCCE
jgi:hypothetical protein